MSSLVAAAQTMASVAVPAEPLLFHVAAEDARAQAMIAHEEAVLEVPATEIVDVADEEVRQVDEQLLSIHHIDLASHKSFPTFGTSTLR